MSQSQERPAVAVIIEDLYSQAGNAEDLATLKSWEAELEAERAGTLVRSLGHEATGGLLAEAAGSYVPVAEVAGQTLEGAYSHNRRA